MARGPRRRWVKSVVDGLVFFGGGDGVCYAFDALGDAKPAASVEPGDRIACGACGDLTAIRRRRKRTSNATWATAARAQQHQGHADVLRRASLCDRRRRHLVGQKPSVGAVHRRRRTGDITHTGLVWSCPVDRHCCSTPSIHDGLLYVADCGGKVRCLDAKTGHPYWVHDARGEIWTSTLVADGKVYIGTRKGDFWVLAAGKQKRVLSSIRLEDPIHSTVVAANGTLYVGTMTRLYALQQGRMARRCRPTCRGNGVSIDRRGERSEPHPTPTPVPSLALTIPRRAAWRAGRTSCAPRKSCNPRCRWSSCRRCARWSA